MLILTFPGIQSWNWDKGLGCTISVRSSTLERRPSTSGEEKDWFLDGWGQKLLLHCTARKHCCHFLSVLRGHLIYLWRKVVCFVLYLWDPLNRDVWDPVLGGLWKKALVHGLGSMVFGLAVQKLLNIEWFFHWKLNCSWKFWRGWNVPLVLLERAWWTGFNGIYLVRFGFKMWEILILKLISAGCKFKWNPKKPGFGRKNQLRTW